MRGNRKVMTRFMSIKYSWIIYDACGKSDTTASLTCSDYNWFVGKRGNMIYCCENSYTEASFWQHLLSLMFSFKILFITISKHYGFESLLFFQCSGQIDAPEIIFFPSKFVSFSWNCLWRADFMRAHIAEQLVPWIIHMYGRHRG